MRRKIARYLSPCRGVVGALWAALFSGSSFAATTNVNIVDFAFSPASVRIKVNDQVKWNWTQFSDHSTTSDMGLWDSGVHGPGFSYTHAFPSTGSFPYRCTVHSFTGSVVVQPNSPPSVSITNPANGVVLSAPATFTLQAAASDNDGSVTNVQFFQGVSSLGNVSNSPYSCGLSNFAASDYSFSAVASDTSGAKSTNTITIHIVTPVPITLTAPRWLSSSNFEFSYSANIGLKYSVERALDLGGWLPVSTNTATNNPMVFNDNSGAAAGKAFYRVRVQPNP